jgi:hypothetical protein
MINTAKRIILKHKLPIYNTAVPLHYSEYSAVLFYFVFSSVYYRKKILQSYSKNRRSNCVINVNQCTWQYRKLIIFPMRNIIEATEAYIDNKVAAMFDFASNRMSPG